ncbi:hypothetical protein [Streptomyces sp. NBC_00059]|uniref:SCO2400 family protein n=1 Tax=Streptomyces sp. NBC_00059 TaxID=2975635 RepID=UPI00225313EE|nr:hypothetical protein [Streptomyces sp. NBC_00059]MCX5412793.1 hypothetical protein [Streptomyces sp. NBC_00059]
MDYCHPCQRHLNGALACAGCGTPADALSPYAVTDGARSEPEPADETLDSSGTAAGRRRARGADGRRASSGRRGRRAHRRRGRALLLTGVGVVLALGALSLAELATEPEGDSGAADYVTEATASADEAVPSASRSTAPDDEPVDVPTVVPVTDARTQGATDAPAPTGAPQASPSASAPEDARPSTSAPADPEGSEEPDGPPPSDGPTTAPADPEPSQEPAPTPSPSETCEKWLWFCI